MGTNAALTAYEVVENVQYVLAIELLIAAQALEFAQNKPGPAVDALYKRIRIDIPKVTNDSPFTDAIEQLRNLVKTGTIVDTVERITGELL
jgi:histidine ammonia-lyase